MQLAVLHILRQKRNSWQKSRWVDGREKTILGFEIQKISVGCRRVEITEAQNLLGSVPAETGQSFPPPGAEKGFSSQGGERGSCESSDATSETGLGILTACTSPSQQALWGGEVAVTPDEMSDLGRRGNLWLRSRVRLKGVGERRGTASARSPMPSTAQGE